MLKSFKKLFRNSNDQPVDLSRRKILKGAAALSAIAVVVSVAGVSFLEEKEREKLLEEIKSGLVEGRDFYLDKPGILEDVDNLVFNNCRFICSDDFVGDHIITVGGNCKRISFTSCAFIGNGYRDSAIKVEKYASS